VGELIENTMATRYAWQKELIVELTAAAKPDEEKQKELQKAEARMAAFQEKYKEALAMAARRKRDMKRRMSTAQQPVQGAWEAFTASCAGGRVSMSGRSVIAAAMTHSSSGPQSARSSITSNAGAVESRKGSGIVSFPLSSPKTPNAMAPEGSENSIPHCTGASSPNWTSTEATKAVAAAILARTRTPSGLFAPLPQHQSSLPGRKHSGSSVGGHTGRGGGSPSPGGSPVVGGPTAGDMV